MADLLDINYEGGYLDRSHFIPKDGRRCRSHLHELVTAQCGWTPVWDDVRGRLTRHPPAGSRWCRRCLRSLRAQRGGAR